MRFLGGILKLFVVAVICVGALLFFWPTEEDESPTISTSLGDEIVVMRPEQGSLIVSTISATEFFSREFSRSIPFADTTAQIQVRAVYQYQIPLDQEWKIRRQEQKYFVVAKRERLTIPVAVDFKTLQKQTNGIWSFFSGAEDLNRLELTLSDELSKKGRRWSYIKLQRDAARQTVSEFVMNWVVREGGDPDPSKAEIFVRFEDEPETQP